MSAFFWVIKKDLLRFFADRQGAVMAIVVPVVLAAFLGMLFAPRSKTGSLELLVVDQDQSEASKALVTEIKKESTFEVQELSLSEAKTLLEAGDAEVAVAIPSGAGARLKPAALFNGQAATLELLYDPSASTEADIVQGLLTKIAMQHTMSGLQNPQSTFSELLDGLPADADPSFKNFLESGKALKSSDPTGQTASSGTALSEPVAFKKTSISAASPAAGYNSYSHNFAGTLLLFLLFGAQSSARNLLAER
jgi:hypothetical protein